MKSMNLGLVIAAAVALSACATGGTGGIGASATPRYDATFGDAVRQARAMQTLNPEAGRDGRVVVGIDGRAGAFAIDSYKESFRAPPRTFDVLNIGGGQ
jgi:hypothetical protein